LSQAIKMAAQATCIARRPLARHIDAQEGKKAQQPGNWGTERDKAIALLCEVNEPEGE
jgi:hypothetical protein